MSDPYLYPDSQLLLAAKDAAREFAALKTADGTALTAGAGGYTLGPLPAYDGVYQNIRFEQAFKSVTVVGDWGFPTVPEDVRQACITTVGIWARRDVQAFTQTFNMDEARLERPEALPSQVKGLLNQYRTLVS